jgi:hypothetical protein
MGTLLTWEQMLTRITVRNLHPEVQRRFHALILFAYNVGVPLGCGTGWRVQPNPPPAGFAKPGNSWHESCPVSPSSQTAFAIDTVPAPSWPWMEEHCGNFGFRTFKYVNKEPWHIQPTEIPASRKYATTPPKLYVWKLPGDKPPKAPTPPPPEDDDMHTPAVVWLGDGRIDHFVRGDDGQLWHNWYQPGHGWMDWQGLGGQLVGSPGATSELQADGTYRIDVSGRGVDGALWHVWWDGATWQPWEQVWPTWP